MKTIQHLLILLLIGCACNQPILASDFIFIQNNLEEAKRQAAQEGKLIMVDFWASWCDPCIWMDEHTFTSPELRTYLAANYISVRIDIDNIEGYNYKEEYNIRFLPSILILNEQGQLIKKYEESFAPSKLITALKLHNKGRSNKQYYNAATTDSYTPANPIASATPEAQNPPTWQPALSSDYSNNTAAADNALSEYNPPVNNYATNDYDTGTTATYDNTTTYSDTGYNNTTSSQYTTTYSEPEYGTTTSSQSTTTYSDTEYNNTASSQPATTYSDTGYNTTNSQSTTYSDNIDTAPTDNYTASSSTNSQYSAAYTSTATNSPEGLYRFNVYPAPNHGYSLQVGAYYEYGNVLREVSAFQEQYPDAIFVHISSLNGDPCYKILLGHFDTYELAGQQKALLKTKGLDCFVKELSLMGQRMQ